MLWPNGPELGLSPLPSAHRWDGATRSGMTQGPSLRCPHLEKADDYHHGTCLAGLLGRLVFGKHPTYREHSKDNRSVCAGDAFDLFL